MFRWNLLRRLSTPARMLCLAAAMAWGSAAPAQETSGTASVVRIGHATTGSMNQSAGLLLEARSDLLKKRGLTVAWSDFSANPNNCISALIAGHVDVCTHGFANMTMANARGAKLRALAAYSRPQISILVSKKAAAQRGLDPSAPLATRVAALKGLSIARPPRGTTGYTTLILLLASAGLKIEHFGVSHELTDPTAMAAGLKHERWEAAAWSSGPIEQALVDGSAHLWITLPRDAVTVSAFPTHGLVASDEFANRHPQAVRMLHDAVDESIRLLKDRQSGAVDDLQRRFFPKMDPALFRESIHQALDALTPDASISSDGFERLRRFTAAGATGGSFDAISYQASVDPIARRDR
ncbi:MAG: ABC transporter substrate-binding protein [Lautropia sp.]